MQRPDDEHTADQYDDHARTLDRIRGEFDAGSLTATEKRRYIADENARYYGPADPLARSQPMSASAFGILHAEPADPAPYAAAIRRELGWPA